MTNISYSCLSLSKSCHNSHCKRLVWKIRHIYINAFISYSTCSIHFKTFRLICYYTTDSFKSINKLNIPLHWIFMYSLYNRFNTKNSCHSIKITCSRHIRFNIIYITYITLLLYYICIAFSIKINVKLLKHICCNLNIGTVHSWTRKFHIHAIHYRCHKQCASILTAGSRVDFNITWLNSLRMNFKRKMSFFF